MRPPTAEEDLRRLVNEKVEEGRNLDYKREPPASTEKIARTLCAMANIGGGVVIYGIEEDDLGRAREIKPFDAADAVERISNIAGDLPDGPVPVEGHTIEIVDGDGVLVVEVLESDRVPHILDGVGYGRTAKGVERLTRRQLGELFASSEGFAAEFGLETENPARITAKPDHDISLSGASGRVRDKYLIVIQNKGGQDAYNVDYEFQIEAEAKEKGLEAPGVLDEYDPFPVDTLPSDGTVRLPLLTGMSTAPVIQVITRWEDEEGEKHTTAWPIQIY